MDAYVDEIASLLAAAGPDPEVAAEILGKSMSRYLAEYTQATGEQVFDDELGDIAALFRFRAGEHLEE